MNEEIYFGIQGAMSRGESLEKASQTFLNAGYPREEVEGAMNALKGSAGTLNPSSIESPSMAQDPQMISGPKAPVESSTASNNSYANSSMSQSQTMQEQNTNPAPLPPPPERKKRPKKIIWIALILILFIVFLSGILIYLIYNPELIDNFLN